MMLSKKEEKPAEKKSALKGFLGTFVTIKPKSEKEKKPVKKEDEISLKKEMEKALADAKNGIWQNYKNYKKSHGFLAW
jgi:hypothetical protein